MLTLSIDEIGRRNSGFELARHAVSLSRAEILRGLAAVSLTASFIAAGAVPAFAEPGGFGQAEWAQGYDADEHLAVSRSSTPILSPQTYAATEQAIERYRQIVTNGGWTTVPAGRQMKLGANNGAVVALRRRLIASGDLDASTGSSATFDSYVDAAVKHFQARHGLIENGVVGNETVAALNVPADVRLRQLEINLVRLHAFSGNLGERYVTANIPGAAVETVENGVVATRHIAGVGKIDRQSPVMMTKALEVNFNPYWTVPASIIRKDLIPRMQGNANYLTENRIHIFGKDGQEVQPQQINWNSLEATNYKFREEPGDNNSLGVVRINISNPYGVYMHDTSSKGVFGDDYRFISSGCIRVQNVRDYVAWLLRDTPGWDRSRIDEVIRSGQRIDAKLASPVPVYWVYVTAWSTPDGLVQFRDDIYQRDGLGSVAAASVQPEPQNLSARQIPPEPIADEQ
jgi:murein L,D-transpeptidase YcbB/YkuD